MHSFLALLLVAAAVPSSVPSPPSPSVAEVRELSVAQGLAIALCWMDGPTVVRVTWVPGPKSWSPDEVNQDKLARVLAAPRSVASKVPALPGGFTYRFTDGTTILTTIGDDSITNLVETFSSYHAEDEQKLKAIPIIQGQIQPSQ
ncbi:MAG: hypothetical protein JWM80_5920 [Cyanobacteria bacterium RYN_339]|nr:hypothetical protein [Cyanobacteria bacterium RYN_339]